MSGLACYIDLLLYNKTVGRLLHALMSIGSKQ